MATNPLDCAIDSDDEMAQMVAGGADNIEILPTLRDKKTMGPSLQVSSKSHLQKHLLKRALESAKNETVTEFAG